MIVRYEAVVETTATGASEMQQHRSAMRLSFVLLPDPSYLLTMRLFSRDTTAWQPISDTKLAHDD